MSVVESGHADFRRGTGNRDCALEEKLSTKEGISQCDRVRVNRRDEVCAWSEILSTTKKRCNTDEEGRTRSAELRNAESFSILQRGVSSFTNV